MRTEYQELIDEVCALLGTPATLEDREFALIAHAAHDSDDDEAMDPVRARSILRRRSTAAVRQWFESFGIARAREPVRIPPHPAAGVLTGRICLPARHAGVVRGYIWLLDDGRLGLDDPRLAEAVACADRIGALLAEESRADRRLGESLRGLLAATGAGPVAAAGAELAAALGPAADGPLTLVAVEPWAGPVPAQVAGALALCALPGPAPDGPDGPDAAAQTPEAPGARAALVRPRTARAVATNLVARAPAGTTGGIAGARRGTTGLAEAWREARAAARAAAAETRFGGIADWTGLGPYRLLTALAGAGPDPAVRPLLRAEHRELARTAESFLDHAGQAARTAADLGIHRQTLYYRLSRIEHLTGLDLAEGEDRLLLHMALKAARLRAAGGSAAR
jgi:hypothetical protein